MTIDRNQFEQLRALIAGYSEKAAAVYSEVASEVLPLLPSEAAGRWVEWGCSMAQASAAAAVKYFRESPEILKDFHDKSAIQEALELGLQLAARDYGVSLEYFRQCPNALSKIGVQGLREWAQIAVDLAAQDYGTAIEYLKESPKILNLLNVSQLLVWSRLGLVLAQEDLKTKDFLSMEYFRLSPELLAQIPSQELRPVLLDVALLLAKISAKLGLEFLKQGPPILGAIGPIQMQTSVLALARRLAEVAPAVVPDFMGHSVEALALSEGSLTRFQQWAQRGIQIAATNPERAGAYFALKLKISHDELRQLSSGVFLRDISRVLRYYAEGLCGKSVEIIQGSGPHAAPTTPDGIITLPEKITLFAQPEDNLRFYRVMTFHEAGHLEFESYHPVSVHALEDIESDPETTLLREILASTPGLNRQSVRPVLEVLAHFPDAALAKNLWMIVEEGRIDYLLRDAYKGIRTDMDFVITQQLKGRPMISELPVRQGILEALLQLSVADSTEVPLGIADVVSKGYSMLKTVQRSGATVNDSLRVAGSLYLLITRYLQELREEESTEQVPSPAHPPDADSPDDTSAIGHGPMENLSYRNPLDLRDTGQSIQPKSSGRKAPPADLKEIGAPQQPDEKTPKKAEKETVSALLPQKRSETGVYYYDEWDMAAGDYKSQWCRLEEKKPEAQPTEFVQTFRSEHGSLISLLRRYFEYLRPQALKKIKKQAYGEEIDLDAAIEARAERRAGMSSSDRVYSLRDKKTRDVSVAFLIDMSGSTSQQIWPASEAHPQPPSQSTGSIKRVIDVEKEGLLLLGEALDAIGDEFGMFGFSGHSRNQVDFHVFKDFDEGYAENIRQRIAGIEPLGQNRDGTAIRHVTAKLLGRPAKIKLLILLSDGKPLDEDYQDIYSLEDTRMALLQARTKGIHPFCITVDRDARDYIDEMYGDVSYTMITNVMALPQKLPRLYKQLTT